MPRKPVSEMSDLQFEPPMLATLARTLPEGPEWEYEVKLDGYRLQAIKDGGGQDRALALRHRWHISLRGGSAVANPRIAKRAYELYEQRGRQDGRANQDWSRAEGGIRNDESRE